MALLLLIKHRKMAGRQPETHHNAGAVMASEGELFHCTNICWDTDGKVVDLPNQCVIGVGEPVTNVDEYEGFAETLSSYYGFLVLSLNAAVCDDDYVRSRGIDFYFLSPN